METNAEKRACERHRFAADIAFSYFNKKNSHNAEILNLSMGGMCFKSNLSLQPGTNICIRLEKIHPNGPGNGYCEGLHLITLADVKWCQETPDSEAFPYGVGVKYYAPVY
jgi:hypothetical protein